MKLAEIIEGHYFGDTTARARLQEAVAANKPLVVFDCTADDLYYSLFHAYRGTGYTFVGLIPKDYATLAQADDVRSEGKAFFTGGRA